MSSVAIFRVKSCADSVFCWFCRSKISFNPDSSSLIFKSKFSVANSKRNFKKGSFTVFNVNERISYLDSTIRDMITVTTWKVSKYGVISGPYFPLFGLNTEIFSVQENTDQKKLRIWSLFRQCVEMKNLSTISVFKREVEKWMPESCSGKLFSLKHPQSWYKCVLLLYIDLICFKLFCAHTICLSAGIFY